MGMAEGMQSTKPDYRLYLTDVMGTTTPMEIVSEAESYLFKDYVLEEASRRTGIDKDLIRDKVARGKEQAKLRNKDHPDFKSFVEFIDLSLVIGYERNELSMPIYPDARGALEEIAAAGGKVRVFSSGSKESTELGMKSAGLGALVEAYHSSSEPEIGSKFGSESYREIARQAGIDVGSMVYVTDDVKEADAAVKAGVGRVYLIDRKAKGVHQKDGYFVIDDYGKVVEQTIHLDHTRPCGQKAEATE